MLFLLGIFVPRIVSVILYFFTGWFVGVFHTWYWPVLGFVFMPYTMLWYSAVANWWGGQWGTLQIVVLVLAIILDIGSLRKRS